MTLYKIMWFNAETKCNGEGQYYFTQSEAEVFIKKMNKEFPKITHYLQN